ncbi:MAG: cytochrome c biogenesis protein CcsA [Deltaproteobacteria bacterium]|nr:cytochrome c biogenesis protein CcsA [Deltaproteobacteria bacterium]
MSAYCVVPNLILYGIAAFMAFLGHWMQLPTVSRWALRFFWLGVGVHSLYLALLVGWLGRPFLATRGILIGLLTWTCALIYAWLARDTRWRQFSAWFLPIVFLIFLHSIARGPEYSIIHGLLPAVWAGSIHLGAATVGLGCSFIGGLIAIILLRMMARIKSRRPGPLWLSSPSLPALERSMTAILAIGFVALTVTLATGVVLTAWTATATWVPWSHGGTALLAWGCYGFLLTSRWHLGAMGRKGALLACLGGIILICSFVEVHLQ